MSDSQGIHSLPDGAATEVLPMGNPSGAHAQAMRNRFGEPLRAATAAVQPQQQSQQQAEQQAPQQVYAQGQHSHQTAPSPSTNLHSAYPPSSTSHRAYPYHAAPLPQYPSFQPPPAEQRPTDAARSFLNKGINRIKSLSAMADDVANYFMPALQPNPGSSSPSQDRYRASRRYGDKKRKLDDRHVATITTLACSITVVMIILWYFLVFPWPFRSLEKSSLGRDSQLTRQGKSSHYRPPEDLVVVRSEDEGSTLSNNPNKGVQYVAPHKLIVASDAELRGSQSDQSGSDIDPDDSIKSYEGDAAAAMLSGKAGSKQDQTRSGSTGSGDDEDDTVESEDVDEVTGGSTAGRIAEALRHKTGSHSNQRLDNMAFGILTSPKTSGINVPVQLMTFVKQVRNLIVFGSSEDADSSAKSTSDRKANAESDADDDRTDTSVHGWSTGKKRQQTSVQPGLGLKAIAELYSNYPDAEWFVLIRDNTYMFFENLKAFIEENDLDSDAPLFLSGSRRFEGCPGYRLPSGVSNLIIGSTAHGVVVSRAVAKLITSNQVEACIDKYRTCTNDDSIFGLCLLDLKIKVSGNSHFNHESPVNVLWPKDACLEPLTFADVSTRLMQRLFDTQPSTGVDNDGMMFKWDRRTDYATLFSHIYKDIGIAAFDSGIDRVGGDMMYASAESGGQCLSLCKSEPNCIAWSFDIPAKTCWLKGSMPPKTRASTVVSGVIPGRYICDAATINPNVPRNPLVSAAPSSHSSSSSSSSPKTPKTPKNAAGSDNTHKQRASKVSSSSSPKGSKKKNF